MENNYFKKLINLYFISRYSEKNENNIQLWLLNPSNEKEKEIYLRDIWDNLDVKTDADIYQQLDKVKKRASITVVPKISFRTIIWRAAMIFLPLMVSATFLYKLLLPIEMLSFETHAGEKKEISLPDGTVVWLNSCSKITYPEKFSEKERLVSLEGEAYFAVEKSDSIKFIVNAKDISIEVLGTMFNVRAYDNEESATTTLTTGKVAVYTVSDETFILEPDQQLVYNIKNQTSRLNKVNVNDNDWKSGVLSFQEMNIVEIFRELERRFDISISVNKVMSSDKYSMKFVNKEDLINILDVLSDLSGEFNYEVNNKIVVIK